jgi:alkanesulfonate monooxygenase SsuD/methylene tetrahydromethanopterin reductase-like flavin-dependent oxidoreductase (luciferase family)
MPATQPPVFGINVDPSTVNLEAALRRVRLADESDVELVTIQDHPYNPEFLDTWTLLTFLASRTERVRFTTNVMNTPLRPPAMMSKMSASLDVMTRGRVELGLGAGGYVEGMQAWGGAVGHTPGERYQAFKEYAEILRGMLDGAGRPFSYHGSFYQVGGAMPGPAPEHRIPLWFGAGGPRMLRLTGRMADGWMIGTIYVPTDGLHEVNRLLDEGAAQAGRDPSEVRRGYNLFGALKLRAGENYRFNRPGLILGTPDEWIETLVRYHLEYRHDTFIFWPVAGDEEAQVKVFLNEIMPEVRKQIREIQEKEVQVK